MLHITTMNYGFGVKLKFILIGAKDTHLSPLEGESVVANFLHQINNFLLSERIINENIRWCEIHKLRLNT